MVNHIRNGPAHRVCDALRIAAICLLVSCLATAAFAQSYSRSDIAPVAGVSFYSIGGVSQAGPSIALQYTPNRFTAPILEFSGGLVMKFSKSQHPSRFTTSSADEITGVRSPLPYGNEFTSAPPSTRTALSFGYGFFNADAKLFLAGGPVRPYLSAGVQMMLYSWYSPLTVAVAPDVRAGLDIDLPNGFSAFGEIRHTIGISGLASSSGTPFDNATVVAFGFAFLPYFD